MATYEGGPGNDTLSGTSGADTINGNGGDDILDGNFGDDIINGGDGNDSIDGDAGIDTMTGGTGDDIYYVRNTGDQVIEHADEGFDTVIAYVSFDGSANFVEKITLMNISLTAIGNASDNVITGGPGRSYLYGGLGNDVYYVRDDRNEVFENAGEGTDTVFAGVTYTLTDNVERLRLYGTANIGGTGNALDNLIDGNDGSNRLDGGLGADVMSGHSGNDTYYVDNAGDRVVEAAGEGTDSVFSSLSFSLAGQYVENLTLTGTADLNATGNSLDNVLTGNSGINVLRGGAGNDTYYIQNAGDTAIELADQGTDSVISSVTYSLAGQYIENIRLTGTGAINATGNGLDNHLVGNDGYNRLDGGGGADQMAGGLGNDTYIVDNAGDVVIEKAGQGDDTIFTPFAINLNGTNLENVTLTGSDNVNATGTNADNNILTGNAGINILTGGGGNDTYYVQTVGDRVIEKDNQGEDQIFSSVAYDMSGQYVENLTLTGALNINGAGNSLANTIIGNDGNNLIRGFAGNDNLHGGLGADRLVGGDGADHFYFDTALGTGNIDRIDDFSAFDDTIYLSRQIFTAFNADGTIPIAGFGYAGDLSQPEARIIYDPATGALSYDADGASGAGAAVQFATLGTGLVLTYQDFYVFG